MLLGVIPMFCFEIWGDFGGNRKKRKTGKILAFTGSYVAA